MTTTSAPVIAIAHHSAAGHTAALARAVRDGAAARGAAVHLVRVDTLDEAGWALLDAADAIVFGAPTHMGTASAAFHAFAAETSGRWFAQAWRDKLAAGFTVSGNKAGDKSHTLAYFGVLAAQHGMTWVNLGVMPGWNTTAGTADEPNRLGYFSGAAGQAPIDAGPEAVHRSDLATGHLLGERVAELAAALLTGTAATKLAAAVS